MQKHPNIDYTKVDLPEELLICFAKALVPEIIDFYNSDEGNAYFEKWLIEHPEYIKSASDNNISDA